MVGQGWVLGIDFGSSSTAAAVRDGGGVREVRLSSSGWFMPSAVFATAERVLVGDTAVRSRLTDPDAFEPSPKRRLADGEIFLGNSLVAVPTLVAAVLREVVTRAVQVMGSEPDSVVLTHPDRWALGQRQQLRNAAMSAGIDASTLALVTEATAAARFYGARDDALPAGSRLAVFDFGAGTCDVAVLDKQHDGSFTIVDADGKEGLGGLDLDARVVGWVRRQLTLDEPMLGAELEDPAHVGTALTLADRVRDAKEALSEATAASIVVSGAAGTKVLSLTRSELEALITTDIDRAVDLTKEVLARANAKSPSSAPVTIYLTGGSSKIPLVHDRLQHLGTLATLDDPKTVVAKGALHTTAAPTTTVPPPPPDPPTQPPPPDPPTQPVPPGDVSTVMSRARHKRTMILVVAALVVSSVTATALSISNTGQPDSTSPSTPATTTASMSDAQRVAASDATINAAAKGDCVMTDGGVAGAVDGVVVAPTSCSERWADTVVTRVQEFFSCPDATQAVVTASDTGDVLCLMSATSG